MEQMESQVQMRAWLDARANEKAYAELAGSLNDANGMPRISIDELEQTHGAAKACLRYCGVEPGLVSDDVTDFDERLDLLCRPSGTMRRKVRLKGEWYKTAFGAMLAWLDTGEAIALLPRGLHGYKYLDVATGRLRKVNRVIAAHVREEAVAFYRPLPQGRLSMRDLMLFVFDVLDRGDHAVVFVTALASTLVGLLPAWANNVVFGVVVSSGYASLILPVAALLMGVAISTSLIGTCSSLVMQRIVFKLNVCTEAATYARVMSLPAPFFRRYAAGNLGLRVSQVPVLVQQITNLLLGSTLTCVLSLVYMIQIVLYTPALARPAFAIFSLQVCFIVFSMLVTARYERDTMNAGARVSGTVATLLNGVNKLKLAGAEDRAFAKWAHGYAEYAKSAYNRPLVVRARSVFVGVIGFFGTIAIYYYAGLAQISVADFMSFNAAFGQMSAAVMMLAGMASQLAQIGPMLLMVAPILETEPETSDGSSSVGQLDGSVTVSDVSFRYGGDSPYILKDLSFSVRPGEYVALVGKSGCGKSTIIRLLLGLEKPERGGILYGRYDVSKVNLRSLRSQIGIVMQNGGIFRGNIISNITISAPSATLEDAWEAAELAGIAEDIRKMPMGMQTLVSESGGMSGGQRQRIMIARAVCGKKRILIFDEATSALDNVTQRHVTDALGSLDCTRIVVAHRLSTVRHCDRILVVEDGCIVEEGGYEELVAKGGAFANLIARQQLEAEM